MANENVLTVAKEESEDFGKDFMEAFPGLVISPGIKQKPRARVEWYLQRIVEAYPLDEYARLMELGWLLNKDYIDLIRTGEAPPPMSRPWFSFLVLPPIFKQVQKIFIADYKAVTGRMLV